MGVTPSTSDIKAFIIDTLALEELTPEDIPDDESLFEGGLGLDSIDTLELAIALRQHYHLPADDALSLRRRLGTVRAIAEYLATHPAKDPLAG